MPEDKKPAEPVKKKKKTSESASEVVEKRFNILRMFVAIMIALLISLALIFFVSKEPLDAIKYLVTGPFKNIRSIGNVLEAMCPLMFTGTAVCVMFSANQINLATEGGFHIGGVTAAVIVLETGLTGIISPIAALIAAALAGGIVALIPALMKIYTNTNEMVSSLMLNYICLWLGTFILMHWIGDPALGSGSYKLPDFSELPAIIPGTNVHAGFLIAVAVCLLAWVFLYKTKTGYELRLAGSNREFARYSGISIVKVILISQVLGGLIAGLGGGVELLSPLYSRFTWTSLLGYGWDGIIICTLSRKNPIFVPLAALFLAYLRTGASIMARYTDVTLEIVQITQAIIILLVGAEQFLFKMKNKMIAKEAKKSLQEGS